MKELSFTEMRERQALLMLYAAYTSLRGKSACAKGAFGPEIEGIVANGWAIEAHGGWMMTDAGAEHWEVDVTQMSESWKTLDDLQIAILRVLVAAPLEDLWVDATTLPQYSPYDRAHQKKCKDLVKIGLIIRKRLRNKRVRYAITPKGRSCLKRVGHTAEVLHA